MNPFSSKLLRKLLTRPIWTWERRRPYPIRQKVFALPPRPVNSQPEVVLGVLTVPSTACDAAWCAYSFLAELPATTGLAIIVDGILEPSVTAQLKNLFPGLMLETTRQAMDRLAKRTPHLMRLAQAHPMGRKAAMIGAWSEQYHLLYADSDILCLAPMPEVVASLGGPKGFYLQDVNATLTDAIVAERARQLGYPLAATMNDGFLYIPRGTWRNSLVEELLSGLDLRLDSWFVGTTVAAAIMENIGAVPLPKDKYVTSVQRQFYWEEDVDYQKVCVRHYVTPVRHLMYAKGLPKLWRRFHAVR